MVWCKFEPSAACFFLLVQQLWVLQDATSLNLCPLFAEAAFEWMLPADCVLGVDEHAKCGFAIVGIYLEVLVGESTSDSLEQDESKIKLCVIVGQSVNQGMEKLFTPE
jgi:hypothetical protein